MRGHVQRIQTGSQDVDRLQSAIIPPLNGLLSLGILDGREIKSVSLASGQDNSVEHKLGREYQGYLITSQNANATVWVSSVQSKQSFLVLSCSANVTVDLWVF